MTTRPLLPLFLTAATLAALPSCHISNRGMDFSPLTDRFEPAVDDDVVLEGDTTSISTPVATPTNLVYSGTPEATNAPSEPAAPETPVAPSPAAPAATTASGTYTVVAGDTLSGIAHRHHTTVAQLCSANGLTPAAPLKIGQKLRISAAGSTTATAAPAKTAATKPAAKSNGKARTHTVQSGETLYAIARKHGVTPAALMQANKLTPQTAGKLRIGTTLTIPAK